MLQSCRCIGDEAYNYYYSYCNARAQVHDEYNTYSDSVCMIVLRCFRAQPIRENKVKLIATPMQTQ